MELSQTDTYLSINAFFISNTFMCNVELKLAKYQANAKQQPEAEFWLFQNYSHSLSTLSSIRHVSKTQKTGVSFFMKLHV